MTALIVLLIVLSVLCLLSFIRVGAQVEYSSGGLFVRIRVGKSFLTVIPGKKSGKEKKRRGKKPEAKKEKKPGRGKEISGLVRELIPVGLDAAGKLRRKIRLCPLEAYVILPGMKDPAAAAIRYGQVNAVLGVAWPALNQAFDIRQGRVGIRTDFCAGKADITVKAGVSLRINQGLWLSIQVGAAALSRLSEYRSKTRKGGEDNGRQSSHQ